METKLKLVFRSQKLKLALKALVFAGLLALAGLTGFHPLTIAIFLVGAVFLYASPLFKTIDSIKPFLVLITVSLLALWSAPIWFLVFLTGYFAALFYLLLGVKEIAFLQRAVWYRALNVGLAYPVFILFFYHGQAGYLFRAVPFFAIILLLLGDFLKQRAVYWLLAVVLLEVVWAIGLLSIGFMSAANLSLLTYFILSDLARRQLNGELNRRTILTNATLFAALFIIVLGLSRWAL